MRGAVDNPTILKFVKKEKKRKVEINIKNYVIQLSIDPSINIIKKETRISP